MRKKADEKIRKIHIDGDGWRRKALFVERYRNGGGEGKGGEGVCSTKGTVCGVFRRVFRVLENAVINLLFLVPGLLFCCFVVLSGTSGPDEGQAAGGGCMRAQRWVAGSSRRAGESED